MYKRQEVTRIVTPGTNCFTGSLDETRNNYLMGIVSVDHSFGISIVDVTTGEYMLTEVESVSKLLDEVNKSVSYTHLDVYKRQMQARLQISVFAQMYVARSATEMKRSGNEVRCEKQQGTR